MTCARLKPLLPWLAGLAFGLASFLVWRDVRAYGLSGMGRAIAAIPLRALVPAGAAAALSYGMLTLSDWLGVRYAGRRIAWRSAALASFVSLSIGHSLGLAPLGSGALRARYYGRWGCSAEEIGKIILFCAATVTLGEMGLAGIVLLVEPAPPAQFLHLGPGLVRLAGAALVAATALYLGAACCLRRAARIGRFRLALPPLGIAAPQVAAGMLNFLFLTLVLYVLVAASRHVRFATVAAIYVLASAAALVSHVPGGLGVTESVVLSLLPGPGTWGALIVFRIVYYIVPLALGGLTLAGDEVLGARQDGAAASVPALRK